MAGSRHDYFRFDPLHSTAGLFFCVRLLFVRETKMSFWRTVFEEKSQPVSRVNSIFIGLDSFRRFSKVDSGAFKDMGIFQGC